MKYAYVVLMVFIVALYGCASKVVESIRKPQTVLVGEREEPAKIEREEPAKKGEGGLVEEELARSGREREKALREEAAKASSLMKDIYFDYDSYVMRSGDIPRLKEIGDWLKLHMDLKVTIEGHCDERGTTEYNLVLGQKRAETVRDHLVRLGVDEKRITTISYGKEAPRDPGHTEEAWAENRRAHFKTD